PDHPQRHAIPSPRMPPTGGHATTQARPPAQAAPAARSRVAAAWTAGRQPSAEKPCQQAALRPRFKEIIGENEGIVDVLAAGEQEQALELLRRHRERWRAFLAALAHGAEA